jgi:sugar phosphate permease
MSNNKQIKALAWIFWIFAAAFYSYEFFIRVSPEVMIPDLMHTFKVDAETLGLLSAFYYYAYAIMQIPVGVLLDRFGIHRLLGLAAALVAAGCFLFAHTHSLYLANFARVLMGIGSAFSFVGCLKLASNWFSVRRFATIVGLTNMIGTLGAITGEGPLAKAVISFGWRSTVISVGITGVILALLLFFLVKDSPEKRCVRDKNSNAHFLGQGLLVVLKSPQTWMVAIVGGLMVAPISGFTELWSVPFLMKAHMLSRPTAGYFTSIMFIGIAIGGPCNGAFAGILGRRKPVIFTGALGALVCLSAIIYLPIQNYIVLVSLLFLFGFLTSSMLLCFTINKEINPKWTTGVTIGFTNMLVMIGGTIFQPLIGHLLDVFSTQSNPLSTTAFTLANYRSALSLLPACLIAALIVIAFFMKESYIAQEELD